MKTPWAIATLALLLALAASTAASFRGDPGDRLVGLETSGVVATLFAVTFAQAVGRPALLDLAVTGSALSFGSAIVFARFLARWL